MYIIHKKYNIENDSSKLLENDDEIYVCVFFYTRT